jgi:radical SAM superfamily enzyme YgiQ (UPF0313 family)
MKKNVVLLAVNAKYVHSALSAWALASSVAKYSRHPHSVTVVEATIRDKAEAIADMVARHSPDTIGISTYIWNALMMPEVISLLKSRLPGAVIVLGGPEAEHNEAYWISKGADTVIKGGGEQALVELLDEAPIGEAVKWPDPYTPEYLASLKGKIAYLETSRGCPFNCSFCLSANTGVTFLPPEDAKDRIEKLSRTEARTIKLVDRTFNCDTERAHELLKFIIGLDTDITYHFEIKPELFGEETLLLLETAPKGRLQFEAGLQSFHPPALEAVSQITNIQRAERNIRAILRAKNIHMHIDLIAGLPYETLSDFQDSFDRAYLLGAHNLQLGTLKLLHGSILREQAETFGIKYSPQPPYEITSSPWLSAEDLTVLKHTENALRHTTNKSRFLSSIEYAMKASRLRPFELFLRLGKAFPNHGTALDTYAEQVYSILAKLEGVDEERLLILMTFDWLTMVKGKNMPRFLRKKRSWIIEYSKTKDPVTGLWKIEIH